LKKIILSVASAIGFFALSYVALNVFTAQQQPPVSPNHESDFKTNYNIYSLPTPAKLTFAGEAVPTDIIDVKERLDRELLVNTYWQSQTVLFLKRANRYFPIIEPILKKNGIPDDFKYLAIIESGLDNVVSPAGATGFWQIMKGTATDFGLEVNGYVDERYNLELATQFACDYLNEAYSKFGSWTMAAASYNMGMNGLSSQLKRQKTNNYYDLLFVTETARYVFRILAVKQILSHYDYYGFHVRPQDLYPVVPTTNFEVDSTVSSLADFAYAHKLNYKLLKKLNPWLRETQLPNSKRKKYQIKLPVNGAKIGFKPNKIPDFNTDPLLNNAN
jgi:hypothetical protein